MKVFKLLPPPNFPIAVCTTLRLNEQMNLVLVIQACVFSLVNTIVLPFGKVIHYSDTVCLIYFLGLKCNGTRSQPSFWNQDVGIVVTAWNQRNTTEEAECVSDIPLQSLRLSRVPSDERLLDYWSGLNRALINMIVAVCCYRDTQEHVFRVIAALLPRMCSKGTVTWFWRTNAL